MVMQSGFYKSVVCPQFIATEPTETSLDPFPPYVIEACPTCEVNHSFVLDHKKICSTPGTRRAWQSYCESKKITTFKLGG